MSVECKFKTIVDVSVGAESVSGVVEHPLGLRRLRSDHGEDGGPYLEYAINEGNRSIVRRVVWVGFAGFVYKLRGTNAPFSRCVAMFGHYLEEDIYKVVGCVRWEFDVFFG